MHQFSLGSPFNLWSSPGTEFVWPLAFLYRCLESLQVSLCLASPSKWSEHVKLFANMSKLFPYFAYLFAYFFDSSMLCAALCCFVMLCAALKSQKDAAKDLDNADCNSSAAARRSCNTFCRFNTVQLHLLKAKKSKMKKTKYCANSLQNLQDVHIIPSTRDQTSTLLTIFVLGKQSSPNRTNVFHSNETTKDAQRSIMQCL